MTITCYYNFFYGNGEAIAENNIPKNTPPTWYYHFVLQFPNKKNVQQRLNHAQVDYGHWKSVTFKLYLLVKWGQNVY